MLIKYLILLIGFYSATTCICQHELRVTFNASGINEMMLEKKNVSIEKLQFYISNISLTSNSDSSAYNDSIHYLIKLSDAEDTIKLNIPSHYKYDKISFELGVDSLVNVAGALGGDLDPIHGMYWTWQSGYINFKLEGSSPLCNSRKNKFTYHLGGFQGRFKSKQIVELPVKSTDDISIILDLNALFEQIEFADASSIMSPSLKAVKMSEIVASSFKVRSE